MKSVLYLITMGFLCLLIYSCSANSMVGSAKNSMLYSKSFKDSVDFLYENVYFDNANFREAWNSLEEELRSRKINLIPKNDDGKTRFKIYITNIDSKVTPSTDTYTDDDGYTYTVDTSDYFYTIDGLLYDFEKKKILQISAKVTESTRAGKTIFGGVGERGGLSVPLMEGRANTRFAGKVVMAITDLLKEEAGQKKPNSDWEDWRTDISLN